MSFLWVVSRWYNIKEVVIAEKCQVFFQTIGLRNFSYAFYHFRKIWFFTIHKFELSLIRPRLRVSQYFRLFDSSSFWPLGHLIFSSWILYSVVFHWWTFAVLVTTIVGGGETITVRSKGNRCAKSTIIVTHSVRIVRLRVK